jgi:hypothetical protein
VKADARPDLEGRTAADLTAVAGDGTCCTTDTQEAAVPAAACC